MAKPNAVPKYSATKELTAKTPIGTPTSKIQFGQKLLKMYALTFCRLGGMTKVCTTAPPHFGHCAQAKNQRVNRCIKSLMLSFIRAASSASALARSDGRAKATAKASE
jgi:hypothetical protein